MVSLFLQGVLSELEWANQQMGSSTYTLVNLFSNIGLKLQTNSKLDMWICKFQINMKLAAVIDNILKIIEKYSKDLYARYA